MVVFINPGSGPVADASLDNAKAAMDQFVTDLRERGHDVGDWALVSESDDEGRWQFTVVVDEVKRRIDMPGIPVDNVRYMQEPDQNIWHFPRLYVDGSSWVWCFALDVCKRKEEEVAPVGPHLVPHVTDRGFKQLPLLNGSYDGHTVRVYESSAASGPHLWLSVKDGEGKATVHLEVETALRLADQIQLLAREHYQLAD